MLKSPGAPEAPADESVPSTVPLKPVPPCKGMVGRRCGSPEVELDNRIGAACEEWRVERLNAMRAGTKARVDETVEKK